MHHTQGPGTISLTDSAQGANRLSMTEHTASCNAGTRYSRLFHRRCASLDLEAAFKQIKISQNIKPKCVQRAQLRSADAKHSCQGCRAPLHHQCLPILVVTTKIFPTWWKTNRCIYYILLYNHLQMRKLIEKLQQFAEHLYTTG